MASSKTRKMTLQSSAFCIRYTHNQWKRERIRTNVDRPAVDEKGLKEEEEFTTTVNSHSVFYKLYLLVNKKKKLMKISC